jgi:hypothetical protein
MPPPVQKQVTGELFRMPLRLYLSDKDGTRTINATGENAFEVTGSGEAVRIEVDSSTGLPARMSYQSIGMQGAPQQVVAIYGDWRDVGGLKVPHKVIIEQGGQKFAEGVVSDVKFNSGLTAEEVGKKP